MESLNKLSALGFFEKYHKNKPAHTLTARQYLERNRKRIAWADTVLEHGKEFKTPDEKLAREIFDALHRDGKPISFKDGRPMYPEGECFMNSFKFIRATHINFPDAKIYYVEGITVTAPKRPLLHAWTSYKDKVIDPTWHIISHFVNYMGIEFPIDFVHQLWKEKAKKGFIRSEFFGHNWKRYYAEPVTEYLRSRKT